MASLNIIKLREDIKSQGLKWEPIELPRNFKPRGLGWNPTPPEITRGALETAQRLMVTRMPHLFRQPMNLGTAPTPQGGLTAGPSYPRSFDWRTQGVIGPVTDQGWAHVKHRI